MPKTEVEIMRTVTVTREEFTVVELDIPQRILDEGDDEVLSWIDAILDKDDDGTLTKTDKTVYEAVTGATWDVNDEDESTEYDEAVVLN